MTHAKVLLRSVALLIAAAASAKAQTITGTILGVVTDTSGAGMSGATITLTNIETGAVRGLTTDAAGHYRGSGLGLGRYEVRAEQAGFQSVVRAGIVLTVGREAVVNFTLAPAKVVETVVVSGEAGAVNTTQSSMSQLVDEKTIRDLPLNGRDFAQLILLQPGVTLSRSSISSSNVGRGIKISVSGARPNQNLFTLDGNDYNDALNNTPGSAQSLMTGVETIKEFQVLTNTYSAEYGRAGGGVFNVVTKAGTNDLHGSVFEFNRNDRFDEKNFFDTQKPPFSRNQFGMSLGGALARNKTFFFISYEGLRETKGITSVGSVPDLAARQGILPGRAPLAINPNVLPFLNLFPLPTGGEIPTAQGGPSGTAEFRGVSTRHSNQDFASIRVDHRFSDRHSMFARYLYDDSMADEFPLFPAFPNLVKNRKHVVTLQETSIISPRIVNEVRLGLNHSNPREDINPLDPHNEIAFAPGKAFGSVQVTGLTEIGTDRNNPKNFGQDQYQIIDNLSIWTGRHALKMGFNLSRFHYDGFSDSRSRGRLVFSSLTNFLTGTAQSFELAKPGSDFSRRLTQDLVGVYVQDDVKMGSRLTFNLGVRWEFVTTPKEQDGKISNLRSITDSAVTIGDPYFQNATYKQVAPRVGLAWDVGGDGKTAVRSGFGVFYEEPLFFLYRSPLFRSSPFVDRGVINAPVLPIDISRLGSGGVPDTESEAFNMKSSYNLQYNVNVQRTLPFDCVVSAAYVGSIGRNLFGQGDINTAIPQTMNGQDFFPANSVRRNPNFGAVRAILQGFRSRYNGLQLGFVKRSTHGFKLQASYTYGDSQDNRSGAGGREEYRNGQPRTFDPYNFDADWGRSDFDVRHTLVVNLSYELPLGESRLGKGWQVNAIGTYASGSPFSPVIPGDPTRQRSTDNASRPNLVPGVSLVPQGGQTADQWFNPLAFSFPGLGFRGNAGRNILTGPDFAVVDLSLAKTTKLKGNVALELRLEVFNALNRVNLDIPVNDPDGAAVFDATGGRVATAGKIFNTITDARQIQLGLRLLF